MKFDGCEQRKVYTMHNILGVLVIFFLFFFSPHVLPSPDPLLSSSYFLARRRSGCILRPVCVLFWADLVEAVLFFVGFYY